jgi:hypothetical protein
VQANCQDEKMLQIEVVRLVAEFACTRGQNWWPVKRFVVRRRDLWSGRDWNFAGWQTRHHFSELLALRIAYQPDLGVAL